MDKKLPSLCEMSPLTEIWSHDLLNRRQQLWPSSTGSVWLLDHWPSWAFRTITAWLCFVTKKIIILFFSTWNGKRIQHTNKYWLSLPAFIYFPPFVFLTRGAYRYTCIIERTSVLYEMWYIRSIKNIVLPTCIQLDVKYPRQLHNKR